MSRRRPDHAAEMHERSDRTQLRSRRRRRRVLRGIVKTAFWALVLAGVFVLGLGYGKTIGGEDELRKDEVTVEQDPVRIRATLPTKTVTVTKTVRISTRSAARRTGSAAR
jgi:hypothetical protein